MGKRLLISCLRLAMLLVVGGAVASCDSLIYDGEGECIVKYTVSFKYDMNMEYADAFAHYVESVTLCAFDASGTLAYTKTESGETLTANNQTMDVSDIEPGTYTLIAWATGQEATADCYEGATLEIGKTTTSELWQKISRTYDEEEGAVVDHDLTPLFHGMVSEGDLTEIEFSGERNVLVPLTKDTNVIRVVLQHLSGADIDVSDFTFRITANNGWMDYDNSLLDDETLTYKPWALSTGTASVADEDEEDDEALTSVSAAVAELTVGRLVVGQKPRLTIYNAEGARVLSIPVIDYALLVKGKYNSELDDQEYLDRQDEYSMTFFLDESDQWMATTIIINSWRVVLQSVDLWN